MDHRSYLSNRSQSVKLSFHVSNDFHVPSGVLQGSYLGPLLFLVFIDDLPRVFKNSIKLLLFADDAKLFCSIQSISDSEILQDQLNKFSTWSVNNCLELNIDKCNIISFTCSKNPIIFNYKLNNIKLVRVTVIIDLGIYFESDFSFKFHHKTFLNKSYRMLGFINRNTQHFKQPSSLKTLYCSLYIVRSSLEFGSIIWSQNRSKYLNDLETVQYKFLKRIAYVFNLPVSSNLFKPVQFSIGLDSIDLKTTL